MPSSDAKGARSLLDLTGELVHDKYRVERKIASGGMGDVYLAKHELLGSEIAIKFMKPDLASDKDTMSRFFKEARIAASTKSEHVVYVSDLGFHGQMPFIVMEFLEGVTLEELIESNNPPRPSSAVRILLQVCKTLKQIHSMGVIHRDLKPSNLMIVLRDQRKVVKILDFGISLLKTGKEYVRQTSTGAILGTPYYMAPEQAHGDKNIDHRSDIYAVGAIMYEMLAHRPPFMGDNYNGIIIQVATKEPDDLHMVNPGLPGELVRIVRRAMAKDREQRYSSAGEMADDLTAYLTESQPGYRSEYENIPLGDLEVRLRATPKGTPAGGTMRPIAFKGTTSKRHQDMSHRLRLAVIIALGIVLIGGTVAAVLAIKGAIRSKGTTVASGTAGLIREKDETVEEVTDESASTAAKHLLSVYTDPKDAWIEVNGKTHGKSPLSIQVEEGQIKLRAAKNGYQIVSDTFDLEGDLRKRYKLLRVGEQPEEPIEEPPEEKTSKASRGKKDEEKSGKKKKSSESTKTEPADVTKKPKPKPKDPKYGIEVD